MFDMFPLPEEVINELSDIDYQEQNPYDDLELEMNAGLSPLTELSEDVFNSFMQKEFDK